MTFEIDIASSSFTASHPRWATLISQLRRLRAPSRLLWRLSGVPAGTEVNCLAAAIAQLDTRSAQVRNRPTANRSEAVNAAASHACDTVLP